MHVRTGSRRYALKLLDLSILSHRLELGLNRPEKGSNRIGICHLASCLVFRRLRGRIVVIILVEAATPYPPGRIVGLILPNVSTYIIHCDDG